MSNAPIDPGKDASALSAGAISVMADSVFGDIAGPVVANDVLALLGLGPSSDVGEYLKQIQAQLKQMQGEIDQLQISVNQILSGISVIEEKFSEVEVTQALQNFTQQSALITENFTSYRDALVGIASGDTHRITESGTDLFTLLGISNMQQVAGAMTIIQNIFLPSLDEADGLIALQHEVVKQAILNFASDKENYRYTDQTTDGALNVRSADGLFACSAIWSNGQQKAYEALQGPVANTFKAFLTVMTQGLVLLRAAWLNSIHADQITEQVNTIQAVLNAMKSFEPAVLQTVDDQIATCLQSNGQRLSGDAINGAQQWIKQGPPGGSRAYPLNQDFLMWDFSLATTQDFQSNTPITETQMIMAEKPWQYGTIARVLVYGAKRYSSDEICYFMELVPGLVSRFTCIPPELEFVRKLAQAPA